MDHIFDKLKLKPPFKAAVINIPAELKKLITESAGDIVIKKRPFEGMNFVLLFVRSKKEFHDLFPAAAEKISEGGIIWISYPKKSSGIKTDMSREDSWDLVKQYGYRPVSQVSLDDVWSAVRLKNASEVRVMDRSGFDEFIDSTKRIIKIPPELKVLLEKDKAAEEFFAALSFTNRKEYVVWIVSAKKEETKARRLLESLEKLKAGKKNPSEK